MHAPSFWWQSRPSVLAHLLSPFGWLYGRITARRMKRHGHKADCPVICVGNWTAGGAGKTPVALAIADLLQHQGLKPVFLSRGYGGRLAGPLQVDPAIHQADDCGDEPLLLAREAPAVIARDRVAGAKLACTLGHVIIMDDGLQNPSLSKSLAFAVVDAAVGLGNGLCIPSGPLRAPLADQWPLTDAVILIGDGDQSTILPAHSDKPVFSGRLVADAGEAAALAGQSILAVAGIGRPEKFLATLQQIGAGRSRLRAFGDHHAYHRADIEVLVREAALSGEVLVTTTKDHVKITTVAPDLAGLFKILSVRFVADDTAGLLAFILDRAGLAQTDRR